MAGRVQRMAVYIYLDHKRAGTIDWLACYLITNAFHIGAAKDKSATILLIFFLEVSILTWLQGASLGHRLLGLKVIDYRTGGRVKLTQALIRTFLICIVITAITYDEENRGIHERLSGTKLVRA